MRINIKRILRITSSIVITLVLFAGAFFSLKYTYAQSSSNWNIERDGSNNLSFYFTSSPSALKLTSAGGMQARSMVDMDNAGYYVDPTNITSLTYLATGVNGSWLPYINGNNYLRGTTYAFNVPWYDEGNGAYYLDPNAYSNFWVLRRQYGFNGPELDENNGAYYLDPNGVSVTNYFGAYQFYDISNGAYYVMPAANSQFNNIYYTGGLVFNSDANLKKNVQTLSGSLDRILKLRSVSFEFDKENHKDLNFKDGRQLGFIAQEMETVIPELVETMPNGYKGIQYDKLAPVIVEAIQEQQTQIEKQNSEIESLKKQVEELKALVNNK